MRVQKNSKNSPIHNLPLGNSKNRFCRGRELRVQKKNNGLFGSFLLTILSGIFTPKQALEKHERPIPVLSFLFLKNIVILDSSFCFQEIPQLKAMDNRIKLLDLCGTHTRGQQSSPTKPFGFQHWLSYTKVHTVLELRSPNRTGKQT